MYEFQCGHQECSSSFTAADKDYLIQLVAEHVKNDHAVHTVSQTLVAYLDATCISLVPDR